MTLLQFLPVANMKTTIWQFCKLASNSKIPKDPLPASHDPTFLANRQHSRSMNSHPRLKYNKMQSNKELHIKMPFFILKSFWRCIWKLSFRWLCKPTTAPPRRTDSRFSNGTCHLPSLQLYPQEKKNYHDLKILLKHSHLTQVCICAQEIAVKGCFDNSSARKLEL